MKCINLLALKEIKICGFNRDEQETVLKLYYDQIIFPYGQD